MVLSNFLHLVKLNDVMRNYLVLLSTVILISVGCSKNNVNVVQPPSSPSSLVSSFISENQVDLIWLDNASNETGFKILRKTSGSDFIEVGSTGVDMTIFSDLGLTSGTTYTYKISAFNSAGNSLQFSNEVTVTTLSQHLPYTIGPNVTDIDGNIYHSIVTSCGQTWSSKNLNVSRYRNGDVIPEVNYNSDWMNLTTGAWCWYNNDSIMYSKYGKLYNWYAVTDPRGLAPAGWHVPSDAEWKKLAICIDNSADTTQSYYISAVAGGAMKSDVISDWANDVGSTNNSGFFGLPGGRRYYGGGFGFEYFLGCWWTSGLNPWFYSLDSDTNGLGRSYEEKSSGYSVRVVKD